MQIHHEGMTLPDSGVLLTGMGMPYGPYDRKEDPSDPTESKPKPPQRVMCGYLHGMGFEYLYKPQDMDIPGRTRMFVAPAQLQQWWSQHKIPQLSLDQVVWMAEEAKIDEANKAKKLRRKQLKARTLARLLAKKRKAEAEAQAAAETETEQANAAGEERQLENVPPSPATEGTGQADENRNATRNATVNAGAVNQTAGAQGDGEGVEVSCLRADGESCDAAGSTVDASGSAHVDIDLEGQLELEVEEEVDEGDMDDGPADQDHDAEEWEEGEQEGGGEHENEAQTKDGKAATSAEESAQSGKDSSKAGSGASVPLKRAARLRRLARRRSKRSTSRLGAVSGPMCLSQDPLYRRMASVAVRMLAAADAAQLEPEGGESWIHDQGETVDPAVLAERRAWQRFIQLFDPELILDPAYVNASMDATEQFMQQYQEPMTKLRGEWKERLEARGALQIGVQINYKTVQSGDKEGVRNFFKNRQGAYYRRCRETSTLAVQHACGAMRQQVVDKPGHSLYRRHV